MESFILACVIVAVFAGLVLILGAIYAVILYVDGGSRKRRTHNDALRRIEAGSSSRRERLPKRTHPISVMAQAHRTKADRQRNCITRY